MRDGLGDQSKTVIASWIKTPAFVLVDAEKLLKASDLVKPTDLGDGG